MASEKNERLVNLVIALLATKKLLTKAQIFKAVAGYEGNQEAADRMFERDKDELRSLGIQIEMKSIDPLFEDEIGYRIIPDRYRFDLGPLTSEEVNLLALATRAWQESALNDLARTTSRRLESLGIVADFSDLPLTPLVTNVPDNFPIILEAIEQRRAIEFDYLNNEDVAESRHVNPCGIYSLQQRWYLYAFDLQKGDYRSFRLDRFKGDLKKLRNTFQLQEFTLPSLHFPLVKTLVEIRRDFVNELTAKLDIISDDDEWIKGYIEFNSEIEAISSILKFSPNIKVIEPSNVVEAVTKALAEMAGIYAN